MKDRILVLNGNYFPIGINTYRNIFSNIATGSQYALDIQYATKEDGSVNLEVIDYWNVIKSIDEWLNLPIRPFDKLYSHC